MEVIGLLKTDFISKAVKSGRQILPEQVSFRDNFTSEGKTTVNNKWYVRLSKFFADHRGEKQSILVNALGTGILAPLIIFYNPLTNEDKDNKAYSALRQPISAVLAIITQLAVCIKANKHIDKLARKGQLKDYDLSIFKDCKNGKEEEKLLEILELTRKQAVEKTLQRLDFFKNRVSFVLAVITLAPTCTVLNWAHPKFIEVFFPDLAKDKKAKKAGK